MTRSGRNEPQKQDNKQSMPVVGDMRLANRAIVTGNIDIPVRTVIFMEVGDTPSDQVREAVAHIKAMHGEAFHPTFIIPVRNRKLTGDVIFEQEILDMINNICIIDNGQIVLRDGIHNIDVMRVQI